MQTTARCRAWSGLFLFRCPLRQVHIFSLHARLAPSPMRVPRTPGKAKWLASLPNGQEAASLVPQHFPDEHPALPVESSQLYLLDWIKVGRTVIDFDARKGNVQCHDVQAGRLLHQVFASQVVAARLEHHCHELSSAISI